ncbi:PH domain-containing protein [Streptomyces laurentii]|uniref:PH domain-containing protein n=1 Tax=Streptomyces laurentii TaxID=39478 RepID=UPI00368116A4
MNSVVLRRVSWRVISWVGVIGLGIGTIAAVAKVTSVNGFRMGWQGIPVFFVLAGILGRIANCKVVLDEDALTVVGPLRTHRIPKATIRDVVVDENGTLDVHVLGREKGVAVFAFGGSLVDHYIGSSGKAQYRIKAWLGSDLKKTGAPTADPQISWTRCPSADASLILCLALIVVGVIWMAVTGS